MVDFPDSNGVTVHAFKPSQNYMESSACVSDSRLPSG